jgi:hypothetical protein
MINIEDTNRNCLALLAIEETDSNLLQLMYDISNVGLL